MCAICAIRVQLYFVSARRCPWNDPNIGTDAGIEKGFYLNLKNEYWTLPVDEFKPENPPENGYYW